MNLVIAFRWGALHPLLTLPLKFNELTLFLQSIKGQNWIASHGACTGTILLLDLLLRVVQSGRQRVLDRYRLWAIRSGTEVDWLFLSLHLLSHLHIQLNLIFSPLFLNLSAQFLVLDGGTRIWDLLFMVHDLMLFCSSGLNTLTLANAQNLFNIITIFTLKVQILFFLLFLKRVLK